MQLTCRECSSTDLHVTIDSGNDRHLYVCWECGWSNIVDHAGIEHP